MLQRRIDLGPTSDEELASLKFRLGRVKQEHLEGTAEAVDLYREILLLLPEHDGARSQLENLLDDEKHGKAAAEILEPMYETTGQWENLIRALEVLVVGADSPEEKLRLLTKIGQVAAGPLDNAGRSFDAHMRALREMPSHADTVAQLEVLAIEQDRFDELVKLVVELAANETDPVLARSLYLKAAEHYATQLGNMDGAVGCYSKILESDPDGRRGAGLARDAVSRARALERAARRAASQGRAHGGSGPQGSAAGADGRGPPGKLGEAQEAIARYREILEIDPASARSLSALDALYEAPGHVARAGRQRQPSARSGGRPGRADGVHAAPRRPARAPHGRGRSRHRDLPRGSVARSIQSGSSQRSRALDAEARARARHRRSSRASLRRRRRVSQADRRPRDPGAPRGSVEQRVLLLHTIADLYETQLGELVSAVDAYARALAEDPANDATQSQLERVALSANDASKLAQIYEQQVEKVTDPQVASLFT